MYYDQGFTRSHWMPPSGDYLLRIAPAAARVTANKTKVQNVVPGHGDLDILLVILYKRVKVPSVRSILYSTT